MNWLQVCDGIDDGDFDTGLDEIARAVQSRRDVVSRRTARRLLTELKIGDRVRLTNNIKPRYYEGMIGEILKISDGAAVVKLDKAPTMGRGRPPVEGVKTKLLVPFIHLQRIDSDVATLSSSEPEDIGDDEDYESDDDEDDDD